MSASRRPCELWRTVSRGDGGGRFGGRGPDRRLPAVTLQTPGVWYPAALQPMTTDISTRPLPLLRAAIDALDRDLLQIVAHRMAIVAEIAAYKRLHGLRVRDREREREVLEDRVRHG